MAITTSSNILTTGSLDSYIYDTAIRNYQDKRFFLQFCKQYMKPAGTTSVTVYSTKDMDGTSATLTEGTTPSSTAFTVTPQVLSLTQYGSRVEFSDIALEDAPIDILTEASFELGNDIARKLDKVCQDVIDAGTNVLYSAVGDASSARNQIDAGDIMTYELLAEAVSQLTASDAPTFGEGFVAVMHPHVWHDLATEAGLGSIISPTVYTGGNNTKFTGEIGMLACGVRVVLSSNVQFYADASDGAGSTGTIDVYPTYVFGQDAFASAMSGGINTYYKPLGTGDDFLNQRANISWKTRAGFGILKEEGLYRIETSSSIGANA